MQKIIKIQKILTNKLKTICPHEKFVIFYIVCKKLFVRQPFCTNLIIDRQGSSWQMKRRIKWHKIVWSDERKLCSWVSSAFSILIFSSFLFHPFRKFSFSPFNFLFENTIIKQKLLHTFIEWRHLVSG